MGSPRTAMVRVVYGKLRTVMSAVWSTTDRVYGQQQAPDTLVHLTVLFRS